MVETVYNTKVGDENVEKSSNSSSSNRSNPGNSDGTSGGRSIEVQEPRKLSNITGIGWALSLDNRIIRRNWR